MTDSLIQKKELLAASVVLDYLQQHPDFFQHYPDLLPQLRLPHQQRGTVSLVERQLELQREKIHLLEEDITRLMSVARQNEHIFIALNALHIAIHQATSFKQLTAALQQFADTMPLVKHCRLLGLENGQQDLAPYELLLSRRLQQQSVYLGRLNKEEQQGIFPAKVHSVALLRIDHANEPLAILAFGSEQDEHFQPGMDVLFLSHLVTLLALVLPPYVKS
ncbi:DUF484 family protein [Alishewanella sp. SMS8]|uniref:DUF484 family protein n=1 Tax=unclassified Alishewanella TaxID=2628974 RepID=UPI002741CE9C|nr:DUF484 family protein [Alishewanella sp. SMS8]MDP4945305.1 DUF484 family protein [Alishewanella sp.]MDP5205959.1 DUF484 family protein [Alishewanella sp. SMS9]MDP5035139.1 DUF484 family protein [Alishewanella sp.]MDP5186413.1 DUF484 family protein [Alishewanella sp.]MDP5460651.1 DUF484 family protein [Alishewanella sp. SMS8]